MTSESRLEPICGAFLSWFETLVSTLKTRQGTCLPWLDLVLDFTDLRHEPRLACSDLELGTWASTPETRHRTRLSGTWIGTWSGTLELTWNLTLDLSLDLERLTYQHLGLTYCDLGLKCQHSRLAWDLLIWDTWDFTFLIWDWLSSCGSWLEILGLDVGLDF